MAKLTMTEEAKLTFQQYVALAQIQLGSFHSANPWTARFLIAFGFLSAIPLLCYLMFALTVLGFAISVSGAVLLFVAIGCASFAGFSVGSAFVVAKGIEKVGQVFGKDSGFVAELQHLKTQ